MNNFVQKKIYLFRNFLLNREDGMVPIKTHNGNFAHCITKNIDNCFLAHLGVIDQNSAVKVESTRQSIPTGNFYLPARIGLYAISENNTSKWICLDFDGKGHKTPLENPEKEALDLQRECQKKGIQYSYLEKSASGYGFHLWIFFSKPISSEKAFLLGRALLPENANVIENEKVIQIPGVKAIEIFPKQKFIHNGGVGNFVWAPWWFNSKLGGGEFLNISNLIEYAPDKFETIDENFIDKIICEYTKVEKKVPVVTQKKILKNDKADNECRGSFLNIINCCPALKRLYSKCLKGYVPSHFEGFSLYNLSLHTKDGEAIFLKDIPGWPATDADVRQLENYKSKVYLPITCQTLQDNGICIINKDPLFSKRCFGKNPPLIKEEGKLKPDPQYPDKKLWSEQSPIRFALGAKHVFRKKKSISDILNHSKERL